MSNKFYGVTREAEKTINLLLNLPASGDEQDWEIELADPSKIDQMLDAFESEGLNFECKSALALLLISSIQDAEEAGALSADQIRRTMQLLSKDGEVLSRMRFYWIELKMASKVRLLDNITSGKTEK
ncbi:MAG: hypothetical protein IPP12_03450 [Nitrospira sp.]|nr:hypothetical protein [Nitrospira sp.]